MNQNFLESLKKGWKGECECCGRHSQVYKRSIHQAVALQLVKLYKLGGYDGLYVHASRLIPEGQAGSGDLSKSKYFELLKEKPHEQGKKKASGYWSLTPKGLAFVKREVMIPRHALVFDDIVLGYSEELIGIEECLGRGFNYTEMMEDTVI